MKKPYSLRFQLLFSVIGIAAFFWSISLGIMVYVAWDETSDVFDDALKTSASLLLSSTNKQILSIETPTFEQNSELPDEDDLHYQIIYKNRVVSKTKEAPSEPFISPNLDEKDGFHDITLGENVWRIYHIRNKERDVEVQVGQALEMRYDILEELAENLIIPALLLLISLGVFCGWRIYYLLSPLTKMTRQLSTISPYHLEKFSIKTRSIELHSIVNALNQLLKRLDNALSNERRFTSDAAHELRTPLAALGMEAQLLQRSYPDMKDPLQKMRDDLNRMSHLVSHLLLLARLDPIDAESELTKNILSIKDIFNEFNQLFLPEAKRKNINLQFIDEAKTVVAHEEFFRILLRNLIDNAIRYSYKTSTVTIHAYKRSGYTILRVQDEGIGASEEELKKLTERFFRVLGTEEMGSGLGLSIVEKIIKLHKATFKMHSDGKGQGMVIEVFFDK